MSKSSGKGRSTGTIPPFILAAACLQERAISRNGFRLASVSAWRAQANSSAYFRYFVGCRQSSTPQFQAGAHITDARPRSMSGTRHILYVSDNRHKTNRYTGGGRQRPPVASSSDDSHGAGHSCARDRLPGSVSV